MTNLQEQNQIQSQPNKAELADNIVLSIIIVNYKSRDYLHECLKSMNT